MSWAGLAKVNSNASVTPDRKTRMRFDTKGTVQAEMPFGMIRRSGNIAIGAASELKDTLLIPGIGWRLEPYSWSIGNLVEGINALPGIKRSVADGGTLNTPSGVASFPNHRAADPAGATSGASGNYQSGSGDWFLKVMQAAGTSLGTSTYKLIADEAAFPSPNLNSNLQLDRIIADSLNHDPNQPFTFRVISTGATGKVPDQLANVLFAGPASHENAVFLGYGQWALTLFGDGRAQLFERGRDLRSTGATAGTVYWKLQREDRWTQAHRLGAATHRIYVHPHVYTTRQGDKVGSIWIQGDGVETSAPANGALAYQLPAGQATASFRHIVRADAPNPSLTSKLRVDTRRDQRVSVQLSTNIYPTTGYIYDDPFEFLQPPRYVNEVSVQWFAKVPAGCSVQVELHFGTDAATDPSLPVTSTVLVPGVGGVTKFTPDPTVTSYRVKIILNGTTFESPTVYEYRIAKDGHQVDVEPGEFTAKYWQQFSGIGPASDGNQESSKLLIEDPDAQLAILRTRASLRCIIDTEYTGLDWTDPANEGKQSVLAAGFAQRCTATKKGRKFPVAMGSVTQALFPSQDWYSFDVDVAGAWQQLIESLTPYWDFGWDPNAPPASDGAIVPYKATDVIYYLLGWAGVPDAQIDIGPGKTYDLPIRLFPKVGEDGGFAINYGTTVAEVVQRVARDYLGAVLFKDHNAGLGSTPTDWAGMWRLILPPYAPYRSLAYFSTTVPADTSGASVKLGHTLGAWPATADPSGSGQMMKGGMIIAGSFRKFIIPPEGNQITVSGTGDISLANNPSMLTQTAVNLLSFDFIPGHATSDPTSPDYLGRIVPIIVVDPNIQTQDELIWRLRRLYDFVAHGRETIQFVAPNVLITDSSDTNQKRPRSLRYGDAIQVNGETYLVVNCNPFHKKDTKQLAFYECEKPTAPFT